MTDDIWVWHYELKSSSALNSVSKRTRHPGALVRVGAGFGCVHPWPELGDLPLDEQLRLIVEGNPTRLASISLQCAAIDGEARQRGVSLFENFDRDIPASHWLYLEGDDVETIQQQGFTTVKIKIGPQLDRIELIESAAQAGLLIRLDANGSFSFSQFTDWWQTIPDGVKKKIEFVEDPVPWNWWNWNYLEQSGVPLAVDRDLEKRRTVGSWAIVKPAVNHDSELLSWIEKRDLQVAVTSYMDHPLGQMWAAYGALLLDQRNTEMTGECGLLSQRCFTETDFSARIRTTGNVLQKPEGTGLGFDDLLEALPWTRLS
ncbi:MAG: enolase C-terminal domain-like protein [Verrucomicrobiales bacterium]|nr:enolase C-terminal domain-like protein [Verrucomicrobiales bacterium]